MDETTATSHPIPMDGQTPIDAAPSLHGDALALGVVLLLASTVLQRAVGFAREICFCRWLSPEQLGEWDMAFGFLMLAGPLLVMSLPGTFGRYVDRYRQAGQLRSFLRRTAGFCAALTVPSVLAILVFRGWFSYLVFGSRDHEGLVVLLAFGLLVDHRLQFPHLPDHGLAEHEGRVAGRIGQQRVLRRAGHRAFVLRPEHGRRDGRGLCRLVPAVRAGIAGLAGANVAELPPGSGLHAAPRTLVAAAAAGRLDHGHQPALEPVRRRRSLHDRAPPAGLGRRGPGRGGQLPQLAGAAALAVVDHGHDRRGLAAPSEPRLGSGPAAAGLRSTQPVPEDLGDPAHGRGRRRAVHRAGTVSRRLSKQVRRRAAGPALDA